MEPDSTEKVYEGKRFDVVVEQWGDYAREIVETSNAVAIVAVDDEGYVTLVRQRREAARGNILEVPAGLVEAGETPLECGQRELVEETGLRGGRWRQVSSFYTTPGFCRERVEVFIAEDLQLGEPTHGADEQLEQVRVPADEIEALLPEIDDAKTLGALLLYLRERHG
jgi:ADP-ribose pyrophosphatase